MGQDLSKDDILNEGINRLYYAVNRLDETARRLLQAIQGYCAWKGIPLNDKAPVKGP